MAESADDVLDRVRAVLRSEPRLDLHRFPIRLALADGTLTVEGEVADLTAKRRRWRRTRSSPPARSGSGFAAPW